MHGRWKAQGGGARVNHTLLAERERNQESKWVGKGTIYLLQRGGALEGAKKELQELAGMRKGRQGVAILDESKKMRSPIPRQAEGKNG